MRRTYHLTWFDRNDAGVMSEWQIDHECVESVLAIVEPIDGVMRYLLGAEQVEKITAILGIEPDVAAFEYFLEIQQLHIRR